MGEELMSDAFLLQGLLVSKSEMLCVILQLSLVEELPKWQYGSSPNALYSVKYTITYTIKNYKYRNVKRLKIEKDLKLACRKRYITDLDLSYSRDKNLDS